MKPKKFTDLKTQLRDLLDCERLLKPQDDSSFLEGRETFRLQSNAMISAIKIAFGDFTTAQETEIKTLYAILWEFRLMYRDHQKTRIKLQELKEAIAKKQEDFSQFLTQRGFEK